MKMMKPYLIVLAAALFAVCCSDDSNGGGDDNGDDTGAQNDATDTGSVQTGDTASQQTDTDSTDSQTQNTDTVDTTADSATGAESTDDTATVTTDTATTGTVDTADTTPDTATELSAAMTVCLAGMATIGANCGWDDEDMSDVNADCADLAPIGEEAMAALFICAAQIECATWADDTASEAATAACLESAGSDITVTEAAEVICDYSAVCLRDDTAVLSDQLFTTACMASWESVLAGQPSVVLDVAVSCVPDTTTCSEAEIAAFEGCFAE